MTKEKTWHELKILFVNAFEKAYNRVDIKDINANFTSTSHYLQNLFDADRKSTEYLNFDFIIATENQELIGYIFSCYCLK